MKVVSPIIRSITSEKSANQQVKGQYTFEVDRKATKIDVKRAIKELYGADVKEVKMIILPAKKRIVGRGREWTKRPVFKKAIVSLKDGKTIDPNKFGSAEKAKDKLKKATAKLKKEKAKK